MAKYVKSDEVLYHIGLSKDMIESAEYVLLPGDPGRVESIAKAFDPNAKFINANREYTSYLANFHGQKILVCSTGMGCPSTGIGVEELAMLGVKYFLRVGTSGGVQPYVELGDVVISTAGVRLEGTSSHYAPMEYPSVASFEFTHDMVAGAKAVDVPFHLGITASSDTFWPGQERYDNFSGYLLRKHRDSMAEWRALGVMNFEMEASALFVICNAFSGNLPPNEKLHAACICGVLAKRTESESVALDVKNGIAKDNWQKAAVAGIYASLKRRGLIKK
jgi:uridine phosphorylase